MENTRQPNRMHATDKDVVMSSVARSGDDRSYVVGAGDLMLGRLYPITYQHLMPATKYRGLNKANITFKELSSQLLGNVDVCMHNYFVPYRAIDKSFENLMTPTILNNMGASNSAPTFDFKNLLAKVFYFLDQMLSISLTNNVYAIGFKGNTFMSYFASVQSQFAKVYLDDALLDLSNKLKSLGVPFPSAGSFATINKMAADYHSESGYAKLFNVVCAVVDFFVGRGSLLDYLGYNIITHKDIDTCLSGFLRSNTATPVLFDDVFRFNDIIYGNNKTYEPQNEYALRAYYAIWFEYYRHYDVEPRSNDLPEWRNFGSASIFTRQTYSSDMSDMHYLVLRIRNWEKDLFTSAGVDDISRHVFAPIVSSEIITGVNNPLSSTDMFNKPMADIQIPWRNPNTGTVYTANVSLPTGLLSSLRGSLYDINDIEGNSNYSGLALQHLRQSAMLENWLKRLYYGGDEYRDRMLSLYDARIEDYSINRPQWLSSSMDSRDSSQLVANNGTAPNSNGSDAMIGTRVASATASVNGSDAFTDFTPEFGIYIGIQSIMPRTTYDVLCYQNLMVKYSDFPVPQFANSMQDTILKHELARGLRIFEKEPFGYARYGHAYTQRVDEVHGSYLDEQFDNVFSRSFNTANSSESPKLSYGWIHCRPALPMFVDTVLLNGQVYGSFIHEFYVEHALPSPVETI